jgi:hypothetical protein
MFLSFLNPTRLRVYPRLIAGTMSVVLLTNALLGHGWMGALGQIIGGDFIMLYSSGVLFRQSPESLYDHLQQVQIQSSLLAPAKMEGFMPPYNYPPYVAVVTGLLTYIPMPFALILWSAMTILATWLASHFISKDLLPPSLAKSSLPTIQVFVIIVSSFAFIEGMSMGQNHAITLLLITAITVFSLRGRYLTAGILAGFMLYKPHFVLGFLIIWFIWRRWSAILGFCGVAAVWVGGFFLTYGWQPFKDYLSSLPFHFQMVYLKGFGGDLEVTPYGLLVDLLPQTAWQGIMLFTQIFLVGATLGLAYYAFTQRKKPESEQIYVYILAIFYPLVVSPHVLLHDMIIIAPALALWARLWQDRRLLNIIVIIYLATFVLTFVAHYLEFAVFAFIPLGLVILLISQIARQPEIKQPELIG